MGVGRNAGHRWVTLQLDLQSFAPEAFRPDLLRCQEAGITLCTMASLPDTAETLRSLYELNRACSADIPDRGPFYSFDEYLERRIHVGSFSASGVVIAIDGEEWVGLSATSDWRRHGYVFNEMTGVKRSHRRKGLGRAMKVFGFDFAPSCGVTQVRTFHHHNNYAMIALNRSLGYEHKDFVHPPE